jgi:hypothetical protein
MSFNAFEFLKKSLLSSYFLLTCSPPLHSTGRPPVYKSFDNCNRPTDVQALGGFYYRRVVSCHCELFFDVYLCYRLIEGGCKVVVEVGRQRNNREMERIKF